MDNNNDLHCLYYKNTAYLRKVNELFHYLFCELLGWMFLFILDLATHRRFWSCGFAYTFVKNFDLNFRVLLLFLFLSLGTYTF